MQRYTAPDFLTVSCANLIGIINTIILNEFLILSSSGRVRLPLAALSLRLGLFRHEDENSDGIAARCSASAEQTNGRAVHEGRHVEHTRASLGRSWQRRVSLKPSFVDANVSSTNWMCSFLLFL